MLATFQVYFEVVSAPWFCSGNETVPSGTLQLRGAAPLTPSLTLSLCVLIQVHSEPATARSSPESRPDAGARSPATSRAVDQCNLSAYNTKSLLRDSLTER